MSTSGAMAPPLSPVLIGALPLRLLPLAPLQLALNALMGVVERRHPGVFERLSGIEDPTFLIDPVDLPILFELSADADAPRLTAIERGNADASHAPTTIRGPLLALLALLEGRTDGDALFFSRELVIEGDTEAVVALRNAVDDAEVDLIEDVLASIGPLAPPARQALDILGRVFARAAADLRTVQNAVLEPAQKRLESQQRGQQELERRLKEMQGRPGRARSRRS